MSGRLRLALVLEFGDPVTGAVLEPDGKLHDFEGWVEMYSIPLSLDPLPVRRRRGSKEHVSLSPLSTPQHTAVRLGKRARRR